jgi:hypothetical protein
MKNVTTLLAGSVLAGLLLTSTAFAGVIDPDCTPEKAAKGAAAKATVGVGGRCKPKEAVTDTSKRAVGIDDKKRDGEGIVNKATEKVKKD